MLTALLVAALLVSTLLVATIICRRGNGAAITAIGRWRGDTAVVALRRGWLGGVVRLWVLWLFVLLWRRFALRGTAVVVLLCGLFCFGNSRGLRVGRGVVAATATAGGQCGQYCAGEEKFCGFHVVYLDVY